VTASTLDGRWLQERSWLGYAGLLPFLGATAILAVGADARASQLAVDVMRYYAAVIASFLGAVHWGVAMTSAGGRRARLRWGVMPALLAWALLLVPPDAALVGFALLFAAILVVDVRLLPLLDEHYRQLRVRLSTVVIATLLLTALLMPEAAS
jgi:hypothetical protein